MAALFPFEVHTPYRLFYSGMVETIVLTLLDGEAAVYANHAPFTAPVVSGILRIKNDKGKWQSANITGGILEVNAHKNSLMVDSAEWPKDGD